VYFKTRIAYGSI